jgi:hypothetical protein
MNQKNCPDRASGRTSLEHPRGLMAEPAILTGLIVADRSRLCSSDLGSELGGQHVRPSCRHGLRPELVCRLPPGSGLTVVVPRAARFPHANLIGRTLTISRTPLGRMPAVRAIYRA